MDTLHLHKKNSGSYPTWLWYPADHQSQLIALMHFSGGSCAISNDCLDEVIYVAGLHGWKVATEEADDMDEPLGQACNLGDTDCESCS